MRGAPPVRVACGQDARWLCFNRALHAVSAASLAGWVGLQFELRTPVLGVWVGLVAALAGLLPPARRSNGPPPCLAWDGQGWLWQGQPAEVAVMLDFDRWLLLRVTVRTGPCWVPLSLSSGNLDTALFRAALQAHAGRARHGDDRA